MFFAKIYVIPQNTFDKNIQKTFFMHFGEYNQNRKESHSQSMIKIQGRYFGQTYIYQFV